MFDINLRGIKLSRDVKLGAQAVSDASVRD